MAVAPVSTARFEDITETTGSRITAEGASMLATRYAFAAAHSAGRRVLEIGCAAGQGFGLIGSRARLLVGADYSAALLARAQSAYGTRFPLTRVTAERLPFPAAAFDTVLCFEASYYVPDMERAFDEMARVLSPGGVVLFVNANPERPDFIRSPHSVHYHTAAEFRNALARRGFDVTVEGAFSLGATQSGAAARVAKVLLATVRKSLERFGLVPRTLRGRALLKRLIYGQLRAVPAELPPDFAAVASRTALPPESGPVNGYKVLYVTARKSA